MFSFDINKHNYSHVHFIGIGGISMSGLAELLLSKGYKVSGSDAKNSSIVQKLVDNGAKIYIGHDENNIKDVDLIVYTSAITLDNPELIFANQNNIPAVDRATFLGTLMKQYNTSIAVSGTHGKTTTTSMIATILYNSTVDATMLLGGELDLVDGNIQIGNDSILLTEACEYKGNFLKFNPTIGIILNIEEDHLDYFKDINHIISTFTNFAHLIPKTGCMIMNNDDENTRLVLEKINSNIITFGINNDSDYTAQNIKFDNNGYPKYNLVFNGKTYGVKLNVVGIHNIYNSLAAIATAHECKIPMETIISSIKKYHGTHRRFEYKGTIEGFKIIDDYAHHPTEIKATLESAQKLNHNKLWCVFQPHTYTRTRSLIDEFGKAFYNADEVIVTDIYAAREKDTGIVHSKDLVKKLKNNNVNATYIDKFQNISEYLLVNANEGDVIITMGAGNVYEVGDILLEGNCILQK